MKKKIPFLLTVAFCLMCAGTLFAQTASFADPSVEYTFSIPEEKWKMVQKPTSAIPNVEYVYGDRRDGHLEVRKLSVPSGSLLMDIIQDDEQKKQFLPGFVAGKEENFAGKYRGTVYNFEYVQAGKPMSGRYYYLRINDSSIYVLRFSGMKDSLRSIRPQTDAIARTFAVAGR